MFTYRYDGQSYHTSPPFDEWWNIWGPDGPSRRSLHYVAWRAWCAAQATQDDRINNGDTLGLLSSNE